MCEIPSNVILAIFCQKIDGFSIGSNDLTQLTFELDKFRIGIRYIWWRDKAVKIMLSKIIKVCKQNNTKIIIYGQNQMIIRFCQFLVKEGIDTISLTPDSVIKNIKSIAKIEAKL